MAHRGKMFAPKGKPATPYTYILDHYGLTFNVGQRVIHTVTKKCGEVRRLNGSQGHYVQVRFDGLKFAKPCHPCELANEPSRAAPEVELSRG